MIGIGVVGVGTFGINHLRAFKQLEYVGVAKLVGCADVNEKILSERVKEFGCEGYTDYKKLLERDDIHGITIATPDFLHKQIALDAFSAGKHVLVEKPLDVTVKGCMEIIEAAEKAGKLLEVDFHKRFDPYHIEMERLQREENKFGEFLYGDVHMEDRIEVPRDWFPNWAPKSSPNWFLGVHFYDLVCWIMKSGGKQVYATGQKKKLVSIDIDTYDSIQAHVTFENGATVNFNTSWILPDGFESIVNQGIRLIGTKGILEVDSQSRGAYGCFEGETQISLNLGFRRKTRDRFGRTIYMGYGIESIQDFAYNVKHIEEDGGSLEDLKGMYPDGMDGLRASQIAEAVDRSLATGEVIDIETL